MIEGIAIIGMSGRFPQARNIDDYWQNLVDGVESILPLSDEDLLAAGVASELLKDPHYVKVTASMDGIYEFDPSFFDMTPREAEITDPQHRLFLECSWEALEHAGYDPKRYPGRIGVYGGTGFSDYGTTVRANQELYKIVGDFQANIATDKDSVTTRVSYKLNLTGPSVTVQTACSTSLVAVHLACQSLLAGESDLALAGGASIASKPNHGYLYQEGGIMSPDGHCRAFAEDAGGTVGGSGAAIVVLKRLSEAISDRDRVYAVIRGSAINNDGAAKVGYTAPSISGQASVITEALGVAGVSASSISYVEAHGTATRLGDLVEMAALTRVFRAQGVRPASCGIGSVKTNVGHLGPAAGVAGLIKVALALHNYVLPASLNCDRPSSEIDFPNTPFVVNRKLKPWRGSAGLLRAGVSSFGIGGTNAHVILEEADLQHVPTVERTPRTHQLLTLSAKTPTALDHMRYQLAQHLSTNPQLEFSDVAKSLQLGRAQLPYRHSIVCATNTDAVRILSSEAGDRVLQPTISSDGRPIAFLFPGQGAQYQNMCAGLNDTERTFRDHLDDCCMRMSSELGVDLRSILYSHGDSSSADLLDETVYTQPALFAVEYALAQLWISWGVTPSAMLGHSIGEYVAAHLAGVFSLDDVIRIVVLRGRLMQRTVPGRMLSVAAGIETISPFLRDSNEISIAAVNSRGNCVVSGSGEAVTNFETKLVASGIAYRALHTRRAFHSSAMDPILDEFEAVVRSANLRSPRLPFVSNVTGDWITPEEATDPTYWRRHLRATVKFSDGTAVLLQMPELLLLEVGPGTSLTALARRNTPAIGARTIVSTGRSAGSDLTDDEALAIALGELWCAGLPIEWNKYSSWAGPFVPLPTYPFERRRCEIDARFSPMPDQDILNDVEKRANVDTWYYESIWQRSSSLLPIYPSKNGASVGTASNWLILDDGLGIGAMISASLRANGDRVVTVTPAIGFRSSPSEYEIDITDVTHYEHLAKALAEANSLPQKILHLWACRPTIGDTFSETQDLGIYSLTSLAQALTRQGVHQIEWIVVTTGAVEVTGQEILNPAQSTLTGLCRVIPQEFPGTLCRQIDIDLTDKTTLPNRVAYALINEITNPQPSDHLVAHRGSYRWLQIFRPLLSVLGSATECNREQGVYLITGGFGAIGLALAEDLARTTKAKLALVGRFRGLTSRSHTQSVQLLKSEIPSELVAAISRIEDAGGEVLLLQADVSDYNEMSGVVDAVIQRWGVIHGVYHAAGIVADDAFTDIQHVTRAEFVRHFTPKILGARILADLMPAMGAEFCVLLSSLSSIIGGIGYAAYASANSFLDSFAYARNRDRGAHWLSVNLDGWQTARKSIKAESTLSMTEAEGLSVLRRTVKIRDRAQITISTAELLSRWKRSIPVSYSPDYNTSSYPLDKRSIPYSQPTKEVQQHLTRVWQELLGIDHIGLDDNFLRLGGHSLLAIQILSRLRNDLGVDMPLDVMFRAPTISSLSALIIDSMLAEIENISDNDAASAL